MSIERPTQEVIRELANSLVQRRIDTAEKVASSAVELANARQQLAAAEKQYNRHYQEALDSSWTTKELTALGVPALTRKRSAPTKKQKVSSPRPAGELEPGIPDKASARPT